MKKAFGFLEKAEEGLCIFMFVLMTGCCIFQVINRNILKIPISWTEELARFSMIWMALLGSEMGLRYGKQMSVEAVVEKFPLGLRRIVEVVGDLACALFAGVAGWYSVELIITTWQSRQVSTAMALPMWVVYLILPLTLFPMCGFEIFHMISDFRRQEPAMGEMEKKGE
ncbi:MAG: TRAP transporter small permease [Lachnospiraceae bacterium]|nr:TRAP transporter small permease [Lachnospiraceae bacterium]